MSGAAAVFVCMCVCALTNDVVRRQILRLSYEGGDTGRLITKKSRKSSAGDADEFMAYARFLQEGIVGYSPLVSIGSVLVFRVMPVR